MRSYGFAALLAGYAVANPLPQGIDWDAVEALPDLPTASIPVVNAEAAQTTIPFEPSQAAAAVEAAVLANPDDKTLERRGLSDVSGCTPDTKSPEQWQAQFNTAGELTPSGYERAYANLKASSQGVYGYMGYSVINDNTYNTQECAKRCNEVKGCQSFNLYYERAPSVDPNDSCKNPASETVQKCVYYGGPVSEASATNDGQWRKDFRVVIAGSNGYVNRAISTPEGYQPAVSLGKVTMNVPGKDCAGNPTYLGVKTFQDGAFSADKCAAACSATSEWNRAHPHVWQNGKPRLCQMFVTYILYNGTAATGQFCAMYDQSWPTTFATEKGQWRDNGKSWFSMDYSYMFVNNTGGADKPLTCDNPPAPNQPGVCRNGTSWSTSSKSCATNIVCKNPDNEYVDKVSNTCVACNATAQYPDKEAQKCVTLPTCDSEKQYMNTTTKACTNYPTCDSATQYLNTTTKACSNYPTCDQATQYLNTTTKACSNYPTCDSDKQYLNTTTKACANYPLCDTATQYLNKTTKACVNYPTCDQATQYLNTATRACVDNPACGSNMYFNTTVKACANYTSCNLDTQYLNKTTNRCNNYPNCDTTTQYLNKTASSCTNYPTCDTNTQYLNTTSKSCSSYPTCTGGQVLNKNTTSCETKGCVQSNLVSNPGFEEGSGTDITGWTRVNNGAIASEYPDTGSKHYIARMRQGANGAQVYTRVKGMEVGKSYKFRARWALGASRNFAGGSCSLVPIFRGTSLVNTQPISMKDKPVAQYQTVEAWISLPAGSTPNADGEHLSFSLSCGNFAGLAVDLLIDNVEVIDASCAGTLVPQQPTCDAEKQWLDMDKNVCVNYPVCSGANTYPFTVLNKNTKTCELDNNATCAKLMQIADLTPTYTPKDSGRTFSLLCTSPVKGTEIFTRENVGYKECIDVCSRTSWPSNCEGVRYDRDTRKCALLRNASFGEGASTLDAALIRVGE